LANGVGTEIDDPAVGVGAHFRDRMPGAPQHCPQIAIDRGPQCFRGVLGKGLDDATARIVPQHIQPAETIDREVNRTLGDAFRR
jgi:hypothetical protein